VSGIIIWIEHFSTIVIRWSRVYFRSYSVQTLVQIQKFKKHLSATKIRYGDRLTFFDPATFRMHNFIYRHVSVWGTGIMVG